MVWFHLQLAPVAKSNQLAWHLGMASCRLHDSIISTPQNQSFFLDVILTVLSLDFECLKYPEIKSPCPTCRICHSVPSLFTASACTPSTTEEWAPLKDGTSHRSVGRPSDTASGRTAMEAPARFNRSLEVQWEISRILTWRYCTI